jgi:hypothetical protein
LAGDRGDAVVVLVVVQDRCAGGFGCGRDQQLGVSDGSMEHPALLCKLSVDVERALPLPDAGWAVRKRVELGSQGCELAGVLGAAEQLHPHHVARRHFAFDDGFVEGASKLAPDRSRPRPRAGVSQLHLRERSRTAHLLKRAGREIREVAFGEPLARCSTYDVAQSGVHGVRGPGSAEHGRGGVHELRCRG